MENSERELTGKELQERILREEEFIKANSGGRVNKIFRGVLWFFLTPIMMPFSKRLGDWYERGELGLTQKELEEYRNEKTKRGAKNKTD